MANPEFRAARNARVQARVDAKRRGETLPDMRGKSWKSGGGKLGTRLESELPIGHSIDSISVLSGQNDPYRMDIPTRHIIARWIAKNWSLMRPDGRPIHGRGLHYIFASKGDLLLPNGLPYRNNDDCYAWFCEAIAMARWLGYVPWKSHR